MNVGGANVIIEGDGDESIVFLHGWPDTHRLWDPQVDELKRSWRCVRFTLPGFARTQQGRAYGLDEVVEHIRRVVTQACPGQRVTLLMHDWGCIYGYQFAARHPQLVSRMVAVDVGDAGSRRHRAELSLASKLLIAAYQLWLATAWRIGGPVGDGMARWLARRMHAPASPHDIGSGMGYPYAVLWFGVKGGFRNRQPLPADLPMLFVYAQRKPFMLHSRSWAEAVEGRVHGRVIALPAGHWVMLERRAEFNAAVRTWLAEVRRAPSTCA